MRMWVMALHGLHGLCMDCSAGGCDARVTTGFLLLLLAALISSWVLVVVHTVVAVCLMGP